MLLVPVVILLLIILCHVLPRYSKLKKDYAKIHDPEVKLQELKTLIAESEHIIAHNNKEMIVVETILSFFTLVFTIIGVYLQWKQSRKK